MPLVFRDCVTTVLSTLHFQSTSQAYDIGLGAVILIVYFLTRVFAEG